MFLLKAFAKSIKDCFGSSNIDLKKPTTVPTLASKKLKKSLKAKDKNSKVVLKPSTTFWFSSNTSFSFVNAANKRPIPIALSVVPIFLTPLAVSCDAFSTPSKPSAVLSTFLFKVFISLFILSNYYVFVPLSKIFREKYLKRLEL